MKPTTTTTTPTDALALKVYTEFLSIPSGKLLVALLLQNNKTISDLISFVSTKKETPND